jgi:hypothetical protein
VNDVFLIRKATKGVLPWIRLNTPYGQKIHPALHYLKNAMFFNTDEFKEGTSPFSIIMIRNQDYEKYHFGI